MLRSSTAIALALSLAPLTAAAEVPAVVADTIPVHSLVAQVMGDLGAPSLLLPPGVSVHDFQMRPSDAGTLSAAQVVIWTGPGLAPWLAEPLETLAPDAVHLELLATDGWTPLPMRKDASFDDGHDHGGEGHDHGEDAQAEEHDHAAEGHDHAAEGHDHAEEGHNDGHDHAHAHDGDDPHAWLSPAVATAWLGHIAETLATADPGNADTYRANATAAAETLATLEAELTAQLAPLAGRGFVVPHDAYQYFETSFAFPASGAIALSDAAAPGPARISELRDRVAAGDIACILTDPQTNPDWSAILRETGISATAEVDADGTNIPPGPGAHAAILRATADALSACLSG